MLDAVPADAKFPVEVEQVRFVSVKRLRDRDHLTIVRGRCTDALAKIEAAIAKPAS